MAQSRKSIKKGDKSPITSVGREGVNLTMPRPQQEHTSKREKQLLIATHNTTIPTKTRVIGQCNQQHAYMHTYINRNKRL
jgi:hypothetical protein